MKNLSTRNDEKRCYASKFFIVAIKKAPTTFNGGFFRDKTTSHVVFCNFFLIGRTTSYTIGKWSVEFSQSGLFSTERRFKKDHDFHKQEHSRTKMRLTFIHRKKHKSFFFNRKITLYTLYPIHVSQKIVSLENTHVEKQRVLKIQKIGQPLVNSYTENRQFGLSIISRIFIRSLKTSRESSWLEQAF